MAAIAEKLNEKGYSTRKNKTFHTTTIQRVLRHKDWYEGKGQVPKILY